jgi:hypothetical protein
MLTWSPGTGLTVDLLLSGYRLFGVTYLVDEKVRLGDLLNARGETISLRHASVLGLKGQVMATLPEVSIEKRHLVAAVPRESEEYQSRQRAFRAGMVRPSQVHVPVLAVAPPFSVTGKVHIQPNADIEDPERSGLARFFPMTDATLFMGEERLYQGTVVLVNRDHLAMIGKTGEPAADHRLEADARSNDYLSEIVSVVERQSRQ